MSFRLDRMDGEEREKKGGKRRGGHGSGMRRGSRGDSFHNFKRRDPFFVPLPLLRFYGPRPPSPRGKKRRRARR